MPKIALFGLFGCGNFGNDGSLEAVLTSLRRQLPGADLVVICHDPELVRDAFNVPTVPIAAKVNGKRPGAPAGKLRKIAGRLGDIRPTLQIARKYDVMIIPGTGILDDFGERPHGMPYQILKWSLAFRLFGKKLAFLSIGAGPIHHPANRFLMKSAARLAQYRSYRDQQSKDYLRSIGLDVSRDRVFPDVAFMLPVPEQGPAATTASGRLTVGLGVMSYHGWYGYKDAGTAIYRTYIQKLTEFAIHLLDNGHDIRFLTGEIGDLEAITDIRSQVRAIRPQAAESRLTAEPAHSLHDLMHQIATTDIVVATRFHNIVCSLKMGKPTISLGYAKKNDVLMESVGLGDYCQHVEHLDIGKLVMQFASVVKTRKELAREIEIRSSGFHRDLEEQNRHVLRDFVNISGS